MMKKRQRKPANIKAVQAGQPSKQKPQEVVELAPDSARFLAAEDDLFMDFPADLPPDLPDESDDPPRANPAGSNPMFDLPPDLPPDSEDLDVSTWRDPVASEDTQPNTQEPMGRPLPRIPGFSIERKLGQGGMGSVYLGRDESLGRRVAIKIISQGLADSEDLTERFENEIRTLAGLQHTHIAQLYSAGRYQDLPYFVMEYVDGKNLMEYAQSSLPANEAARLLSQLCEAVQYCHDQKILHRDLKPANVLLSQNGQPKIADFGLAKIVGADNSSTRTGEIIGTPGYMAPEQASGVVKSLTPACDTYALGAILYRLLTGRPPFVGDDPVKTLLMVVTDEPIRPRRLSNTIPIDLETICLKCLEKNPVRRYTTAAALGEDLRRFLAGEPVLARPARLPERVWKWSLRHPAKAVTAGMSLASVIAVLVGLSWHNAALSDQLKKTQRLADEGSQLSDWLTRDHLHELGKLAGTTRARLDVAQRVQQFLDASFEDMPPDPRYTQQLGKTYLQMGRLYGGNDWNNVAQYDLAKQDCQRALELYDKVAAAGAADTDLRRLQAETYLELANIEWELGNRKTSQSHREQAAKWITEFHQKRFAWDQLRRQSDKYRVEWQLAAHQYPEALQKLNDMEESVKQSEDQLQDSSYIDPDDRESARLNLQDDQIFIASQRGRTYDATGELEKAQSQNQLAVDLAKKRLTEEPNNMPLARLYSTVLVQLGDTQMTNHDMESARRNYQEALQVVRNWAERDKENVDLQTNLALKYSRISSVELYEEDLQAAKKNIQAAIDILVGLKDQQKLGVSQQLQLAMDLKTLADITMAGRDFVETERRLQEQFQLYEQLKGQVPENDRLRLVTENEVSMYHLHLNRLAILDQPPSEIRKTTEYQLMERYLKRVRTHFAELEQQSPLDFHQQQMRDQVNELAEYYEDALQRMEELEEAEKNELNPL